MARGLNQRPVFDNISNILTSIPTGKITNPIYGGWVTAFIRSVISEILNDIHKGLVVSCTTDGFITNLGDLEKLNFGEFSRIYKIARKNLGDFSGQVLKFKNTEKKKIIIFSH